MWPKDHLTLADFILTNPFYITVNEMNKTNIIKISYDMNKIMIMYNSIFMVNRKENLTKKIDSEVKFHSTICK